MFKRCYIVLLYLLIFPGLQELKSQPAENEGTELIIISENTPPYTYIDDHGVFRGSNIDLLEPILTRSGILFKFKISPWKRAMQSIQNKNNYLLHPVARTAERENKFKWILPVHTIKLNLFGIKKRYKTTSIDISSGKYKVVCVGNTTSCLVLRKVGVPEDAIITLSVVNQIQMIDMIKRGRIDFYINSEDGHKHVLNSMGLDPAEWFSVSNYEYKVVEYLASGLDFDDGLVTKIQKAASDQKVQN